MTTTNGNGRRKKSGVLEELAQTAEDLEKLLEDPTQEPESELKNEQPEDKQPEAPQTEQLSAEELLQQAKAETRQKQEPSQPVEETPTQPPENTQITATQQINETTALAAQSLVEAETQAKTARVEAGVQQGLHDAEDLRQGYQVGLLVGLTNAKVADTNDLIQQLSALRSHTDQTSSPAITQILEGLKQDVKINPLGERPSAPGKLKII